MTMTMTPVAGSTGRLNNLHKSSGALGAALAAVPEWRDLREQYDRLDQMKPAPRMGSAQQAVSAMLSDQLANGVPDTAAIVKAAAKATADQAAADVVMVAANRLRSDLSNALDSVASSNAPALFRHLDGQLQSLLTEARAVYAELGSVHDADDAIDAGKVEAWQRLPDLEARYLSVRSGQAKLWSVVESHGRNMRQLDLAWMASPDADSDYIARRLGKRIDQGDGTTRNPTAAPWPEPWESSALAWFARHPEVRAWVPDLDQLDEAEGRIAAACREFTNDQVARRVSA